MLIYITQRIWPRNKGRECFLWVTSFCKPRQTAFVLHSLFVLEVLCIAHAVLQGFVILWIFRTEGGHRDQLALSLYFSAGIILQLSWDCLSECADSHRADFCGCFCPCVTLFWGRKEALVFPSTLLRRGIRHNTSLALPRDLAEQSSPTRKCEQQQGMGKARSSSVSIVTALVLGTVDRYYSAVAHQF